LPSIVLERVEIRPGWAHLMAGRLEVATLVVRRAVLPQAGVDAVLAALQKRRPVPPAARAGAAGVADAAGAVGAAAAASVDLLPRRTVLDDVTWLSARGASSTVDADALLADDGWPERASLTVVKGALQGASASLARKAQTTAWAVNVKVGGGTVQAEVRLQAATPERRNWAVDGQLNTQSVEVAALTAPSRPLSGLLDASTTFEGHAASLAALADAMTTRTQFSVREAVIHGVDLARAVTTVGLSRGGETHLKALAGELVSQGRAMQLNHLVASSGVLSASGNVAVAASRALSGRIVVDATAGLAGALVGIPLAVGGTLDAPELTLTRSAMLGAAIGTVVLPGVGTGAGASLGDKLGGLGERLGDGFKGLFGGKKQP
jgi:hypothetical protein